MIATPNRLFGDDKPEEQADVAPTTTGLPTVPPFIWPDARQHEETGQYAELPPSRTLFANAGLISGLVVGHADKTVAWLSEVMQSELKRRVVLVVVVYPASPTREQHLRAISELWEARKHPDTTLEVKLLPVQAFGGDAMEWRMTLPPTVIQGVDEATGHTVMSIGSVGDAGCDAAILSSFNVVFRPDDALRDAWRKWFQYIVCRAAPLNDQTMTIPQLVPAKGDPEAAELWQAFMQACQDQESAAVATPIVDPVTGEVIADAEGKAVQPWDTGVTALDPLAQLLQQVYSNGWLVTIDEATRIKPLSVPVKATLLGQQSERNVGAVKQKQSFTLQVLDDEVDKAIEKCRKVTDVMELLTYQLSQGNRWIPDAAKGLLDKELQARNEQGQKVLKEALGGDVKSFIARRKEAIRKDLNEMYQQLGQGKAVPADKLQTILDDIQKRLTTALDARVTPRAVYNRIGPPDLTAKAPPENWNQPLSLLVQAAKLFRESQTDAYFPRRLSGLAFTKDEFEKACDIFGDSILVKPDSGRAKEELKTLHEIPDADETPRARCDKVWAIIKGQPTSTKR